MSDDAELLRQYAESRSESAFAELVKRRVGLVYSVALRHTRDAQQAEDVTQVVFTALARKAHQLAQRTVVVGWLYRSAHFAAIDSVRRESRRLARELEAHHMEPVSHDAPEPNWDQLRPFLDEIINGMDERDRDAVLLRYFDGRSFSEVGAKMNLTENAARMRTERALEKVHAALARRGVTTTSAALALALANQAGVAAPVGLAASATGAALAGAATATGTTGVLGGILTMGKLQTGIIVVLAATSVATLIVETRATRALEVEVGSARTNYVGVQPLQDENERLKRAIAALSSSTSDAAELARLRQRTDELRASISATRDPSERTPGKTRKEASAHERSYPSKAWLGILRAVFADDYERLAWLICFDEAGRRKLDDFFARLPLDARAKNGSPEALVARVFVQWRWQGDPPRSGGGGRETPMGNDAVVEAPYTSWSGKNVTERIAFKRTDDGWRYGPITGPEVEQILALLNPVTGEPAAHPDTPFFSRPR